MAFCHLEVVRLTVVLCDHFVTDAWPLCVFDCNYVCEWQHTRSRARVFARVYECVCMCLCLCRVGGGKGTVEVVLAGYSVCTCHTGEDFSKTSINRTAPSLRNVLVLFLVSPPLSHGPRRFQDLEAPNPKRLADVFNTARH